MTSHFQKKAQAGSDPTEVVERQPSAESAGDRVRILQGELRAQALAQLDEFARDLNAMAERASQIADGGEAFEVGARELASRTADDLRRKWRGLTAIISRR